MSASHHTNPVNTRTLSIRVLCLLLALAPCVLLGAELSPRIDISENTGNYRIRMVALIRAPAQTVYEVLTDYRHIYRLNPAITQSAILPPPNDATVRVKTRMEGCIFFFCTDVDRVEDVRELDAGHLQAVIIPELSDFSSGSADWRVQPFGNISRLVYEAEITPTFFIPPLIGSYFVKHAFGKAVLTSFARIECIARIRAAMRSPVPPYLTDAAPGPTDFEPLRAALLAGEVAAADSLPPAAGAAHMPTNGDCTGPCDRSGGEC
jgi:hypothetical protein